MPSRQERRQAARQAARDAGQQSETTSESVEETPHASAIRSLRAEAAESYRRSDRDAKTRASICAIHPFYTVIDLTCAD